MEASYFTNVSSLNQSFGGLMFPYDRSLFTLNSLPHTFAAGGGCYVPGGDFNEHYGLCRQRLPRAPRGSVSPSPMQGAFHHRTPNDQSTNCYKPRSPIERRFYQTDDHSQQAADRTGSQHIRDVSLMFRFCQLVLEQRL